MPDSERSGGPPPTRPVVLVVDDDDAVREAAVWVLQAFGYATLEAADGPGALAVLETAAVDVVFSDLVMPAPMNGLDLAREVRRRYPGLKVLLTTGYSRGQIDAAALADAEVALIIKPYSNKDLKQTILMLLQA